MMTTPAITKAPAIKAEPKKEDKAKRKIRLSKTALVQLLSMKEPLPSINVDEVVIMVKDEKKS